CFLCDLCGLCVDRDVRSLNAFFVRSSRLRDFVVAFWGGGSVQRILVERGEGLETMKPLLRNKGLVALAVAAARTAAAQASRWPPGTRASWHSEPTPGRWCGSTCSTCFRATSHRTASAGRRRRPIRTPAISTRLAAARSSSA